MNCECRHFIALGFPVVPEENIIAAMSSVYLGYKSIVSELRNEPKSKRKLLTLLLVLNGPKIDFNCKKYFSDWIYGKK